MGTSAGRELHACLEEEIDAVEEGVRSGVTGAWLGTLLQDLRYACRAVGHSRSFTVWVAGSLAIGIAAAVAGLALLNASLILPFPAVTEQNRLVRVSVSRNCGRPDCWIRMSAPGDYDVLRHGITGLQGLAAYSIGDIAAALPQARSMRAAFTSGNYFDVLGVRPAVGRTFVAQDAETSSAVAVIAHAVWTREFDADPSVIGRSIRVADRFVQIVGVAPALFAGIDRDKPGAARSMNAGRAPELWLPMWLADAILPLTAAEQRRQERDVYFVGRLRQGLGVRELQAEAQVLASRLATSRGLGAQGGNADVRRVWRVDPRHWHLGLVVVMPIPILVLAIACVNAANLMLARGSQRQREIAIRLAIGAGRGRIIRQLLMESAVLALLATLLAMPIAWWSLQLASNPLNVPIPFDPTMLALSVLTAAVTTVAFGLAPAVRVSALHPSSTLGSAGSRNDSLPRQSRLRRALIIAQVALSLGLLATGSQLIATVRSEAVSGGTPANRLLIARFDLQPLKPAFTDMDGFYRDVVAVASRLAGVEAIGLGRHTLVWTLGQAGASASVTVWRPDDRPDEGHLTSGGYAGGDLFGAVGLRIVSGRGFTDADRQRRPQVAVVNETAAKSLNGPPIGSIIRVAPRDGNFASSFHVRIVGVVESAVEPRLDHDAQPPATVYLPSPIEPEPALALYVRTRNTATDLAQPVREMVARIAPRVPILEIGSLEEFNERSYRVPLWLARAAAFLGFIGLLLATAGLYGVSSYVVSMRSREIAIRVAFGARPRGILAMILGQSMRVAIIGLLAGGSAAAIVSRALQSEYHGIRGIDGVAFGLTLALFTAAMLLASIIPALRASRLDPVENLRDV